MKPLLAAAISLLAFVTPAGAALPGVHVTPVAQTEDFCDSIVFDSHGNLYYTGANGGIYRVGSGGASTKVAQVPTHFWGDAGLLGMRLFDDNTAVVHYTKPSVPDSLQPAWEVISRIDLTTGAETVLAQLTDDITGPGRPVPSEHHGGIPTIGDNGSVYVGIGDFYAFGIAADMQWYAGKILRIDPDGKVTIVASGFRNPYGIQWDGANKRLIVLDNGEAADDEINIVTAAGGFFGWPYTMGGQPPVPGAVPPIYVYPEVTAPTGMTSVSGRNSYLKSGYLIGGYVTRAVDYVPDVDARPLPDPIQIVREDTYAVIDVAEDPDGNVYFTTAATIYRIDFPRRGDCNGDGLIDANDSDPLVKELADGEGHPAITAQAGSYAGTWGCDVNGDGVISQADRTALGAMIRKRVRAVRW